MVTTKDENVHFSDKIRVKGAEPVFFFGFPVPASPYFKNAAFRTSVLPPALNRTI